MSAPYDGPGGVLPKKSRAQPPCDRCGAAKRGVHRRRCGQCEAVICWQCSDRNAHYPYCTSDCKEAAKVRDAIAKLDQRPRSVLRAQGFGRHA